MDMNVSGIGYDNAGSVCPLDKSDNLTMDRTILVTGGAGYIGSHTALELQERGYRVVVLDNLSTGHRWAVRADEFVEGDIRDTPLLNETFARFKFDAIVHFAAKSIVSDSVLNPMDYYDNNVVGTQRLIQAAIYAGVSKFIFSSTAAVYGSPNSLVISEDIEKSPVNPYGRSKRMVELMLTDAALATQLSSVSLRYFNAGGARPDSGLGERHIPETHLIPQLLLSAGARDNGDFKLFGNDYPTIDGTCIRDFVHVKDLARAHADVIKYLNENPGTHSFNLGSGKGNSVLEILKACEDVIGERIEYQVVARRQGDPPILIADSTKAMTELGWKSTFDLIDIVKDSHQFLCSCNLD